MSDPTDEDAKPPAPANASTWTVAELLAVPCVHVHHVLNQLLNRAGEQYAAFGNTP